MAINFHFELFIGNNALVLTESVTRKTTQAPDLGILAHLGTFCT